MFFAKEKSGEELFTAVQNPAVRRADAWLDAMLKRGQKERFGIEGDLTPEIAEILLAKNPVNRTIKRSVLEQIERDVVAGNYTFNGEPIIISREGYINDGQHRCLAAKNTGRTVRTMFVFGLPYETRMTTDQGTAKTPGDYLTMAGLEAGNTRAAIAGYLWQVDRFGEIPQAAHAPGNRPTKVEGREAEALYREEIEAAMRAVPTEGTHRIASYTLCCVTYILLARRVSPILAQDFLRQIIAGTGLSEGHPILLGRNRLLDEKRTRHLWPHKAVEIMLRTWNYTRRRRRASKVQLEGKWPVIEIGQRS
jgi:hypothetical protein